MKKKRGLEIKIKLSNRWLYTFIAIGILMIIGVGVYALTPGVAPNPGHLIDNVAPPADCASGQVLGWDGSAWGCVDASGGGISTNPLYVEGAITSPEGTLRDDGGGWVRTYGATGWRSQTYGGGWYMTDTSWLRAYNNKGVYTPGQIQGGTLKVSGSAVVANTACTSSQWGEMRRCTYSGQNLICGCLYYGTYPSWKWIIFRP